MIEKAFLDGHNLIFVLLHSSTRKYLLGLLWQLHRRKKHVLKYLTLEYISQSSVDQRPWALVNSEDLLEVIYC